MIGKIKWYSIRLGYGWIESLDDSGRDYFVHHSELKNFFLDSGDKVEFTPVETHRGLKATNLRKIL